VRMRTKFYFIDLVFNFVFDPGVDNILGKHIAFEQEFLIFSQCSQRLIQRSRRRRNFRQFLWWETIDVFIQRIPWIDFVFDSINHCHEYG